MKFKKGIQMNTERKLKEMIDKLQERFDEFNALVDTSERNEDLFEAIQTIKEIFNYKEIAEDNKFDNTLIYEEDYSELEELYFNNELDEIKRRKNEQ
mgnify:CR=1 FL=1